MRFILILALLLSSCARPTVIHPGAINSFDSTAYDTLITEQAAIEQAKTSIAQFPAAKPTLNKVIDQYNVTYEAYKVYHASGGDQTTLQAQINSLVTNVASLIKSLIPQAPVPPTK